MLQFYCTLAYCRHPSTEMQKTNSFASYHALCAAIIMSTRICSFESISPNICWFNECLTLITHIMMYYWYQALHTAESPRHRFNVRVSEGDENTKSINEDFRSVDYRLMDCFYDFWLKHRHYSSIRAWWSTAILLCSLKSPSHRLITKTLYV